MDPEVTATSYAQHLADDGFAIFLFHGVIPEQRHAIRNYTRKHIVRTRFEAILDELCAKGVPIALERLVAAARRGERLPARAFAVTFDDGFENNISVALPALRARNVPVCFYVTSGFVDANGWSWTDMIEFAVEKRERFTLALGVPSIDGTYAAKSEKIALLNEVRRHVKGTRGVDPYGFAERFLREVGVTTLEPDPHLDRKMTWPQVRALASDPLVTLGGHGHTHRILSHLAPRELEHEIATSLARFEEHTGAKPVHYSYPEGLTSCYSELVISTLQRHGVVCCPTAEHGVNASRPGTADLFHLRRVMVA